MKRCPVCEEVLSDDKFHQSKTSPDGLYGWCIECKKHKQRANREKRMHICTRSRAKSKNIPFDLDVEDIVIPTHCPILGIPLYTTYDLRRGGQRNSPSIDRVDPNLGYVKGNIQIISNRANTMKQDATPEELRAFAYWVLENYPED